jgi:uncharacterized protein
MKKRQEETKGGTRGCFALFIRWKAHKPSAVRPAKERKYPNWFKQWFGKPRRKLSKTGDDMKPFSTYHLFPEAFAALQQPLVDIILKAVQPDRIFLLGASVSHRRSESIFCEPAPTARHIAHCFLLVLIGELATKEPHEWQDKIETHCRALLPVTTIVMQYATFAKWLKEGHPFALSVSQSAAALYDSGSLLLPEPEPPTGRARDKAFERPYTEGLARAKEFLIGSELYQLRKQYPMAAFMLHQSAEQALRILLELGTGYYANTHSIERLVRYASLVCYQLPDLFPQRTEGDKRLFSLLQKAYIDTRYKEYTIDHDDLLCLTQRVRHLHDIVCDAGKSLFHTPVVTPVA